MAKQKMTGKAIPRGSAKRKSPAKTVPASRPKVAKAAIPATRKKAAKPGPTKKKSPAAVDAVSLGRPKVTGEEKLFLLFKEDYHARQIFDFLGVQTVKDLEQFSPKQIVQRLSQPITKTVDRIRQKLAEKNRCLPGDEEYALQHRPTEG
jgi:hypothetical protein